MVHFQRILAAGNRDGLYSFDARIRAAKEARTHVIPEGDLSKFEWTNKDLCWREGANIRHERQIQQEKQNRENLDYGAFSSLLAQPKPSCKSLKNANRVLIAEHDGFFRVGLSRKEKTVEKIVSFVHPNIFATDIDGSF
jgi:hypothetical protein